MIRVRARAPLAPTEDPQRVAAAVANLFPTARLALDSREVRAEGGDLERLSDLVREHQIPDSARGAMLAGRSTSPDRVEDDGASDRRFACFALGKQAAAMGKPHFGAPRSALGEVEVVVEADTEEELLRALYACAPDTTVPPELGTVPRELRPRE